MLPHVKDTISSETQKSLHFHLIHHIINNQKEEDFELAITCFHQLIERPEDLDQPFTQIATQDPESEELLEHYSVLLDMYRQVTLFQSVFFR